MDRIEGWFSYVESYVDLLDSDRIIYSFVVAWAVAGAVWIVLDWLDNPNRGGFKPARDRRERGFRARMALRRIKKAEDDAAVRATLRDAYGVSSLRAVWNRDREARTLAADNLLVRELPAAMRPRPKRRVLVRLRDSRPDDSESRGEPLLATLNGPLPAAAAESTEPMRSRGRWSRGADPLMLNAKGRSPSPATLRRRVWKNHAADPMWGADNQARMNDGKPPTRVHPVHGKQMAFVNLVSTRPCWPDTAVDPFAEGPPDLGLAALPDPVKLSSAKPASALAASADPAQDAASGSADPEPSTPAGAADDGAVGRSVDPDARLVRPGRPG